MHTGCINLHGTGMDSEWQQTLPYSKIVNIGINGWHADVGARHQNLCVIRVQLIA